MVAVLLICFVPGVFSDSLWDETSASPYTTSKAFKVGDIVTVLIIESTSAIQKAGTDTNVSDSLSASFDHTIEKLKPTIDSSNMAAASAQNKYKGIGATTRSSSVQAKVAAVVTRVLQNGNLLIKGEHRVAVNTERQVITISGMVRPKDVSLDNTVYSYQVANASVSVKGTGTVQEAEEPGWFTKMVNWFTRENKAEIWGRAQML